MSNTPGMPRQSHFQKGERGEIELDITDVVLPKEIPRPRQSGDPVDLTSRLPPEFVQLLDSRGQSKPKPPPPEPKPKARVLPFMKPPSGVSRIISASKKSHTEELKEMARLRQWRDRIKREREQESPSPPRPEPEVPKKRPREDTRKPEQSTTELMMELSEQHKRRMEEQEKNEKARIAV